MIIYDKDGIPIQSVALSDDQWAHILKDLLCEEIHIAGPEPKKFRDMIDRILHKTRLDEMKLWAEVEAGKDSLLDGIEEER